MPYAPQNAVRDFEGCDCPQLVRLRVVGYLPPPPPYAAFGSIADNGEACFVKQILGCPDRST